jgi:L-ascorbate metabolism protein UlaG (beta-lactamase superfamily)
MRTGPAGEGSRKARGSPAGRRLWRATRWLGVLALAAIAVAVAVGWTAFGHRAAGARRARMEQSPHWKDGRFVNPQPLHNDNWRSVKGMFHASPDTSPRTPVPVATGDARRFQTPPPTGLRVTWFGHSSILIEIDGHRVLTDPLWSGRASPFPWIGPRRWYPPPVALAELPAIDVVVISHDHYDHLDQATIAAMKAWKATTFVVPLGVGAHLAYWGIPESRIIELDWWDRARVGGLEIVCAPARHASGRILFDNDARLWAGWALIGSQHRAYYSGDTGLFPAMREIGARLGPFDVTMIEAGQYGRGWPDWHLGPEQAIIAHQMVRVRVMIPVHWGALALAFHGWTEPAERVLAAAARAGATVLVPRPGQSVEPTSPPPFERWWPDLPWKTAAEEPIVSTDTD